MSEATLLLLLFVLLSPTFISEPINLSTRFQTTESSLPSENLQILEPSQDWRIAGNVTMQFLIENTFGTRVDFIRGGVTDRIDLEIEWRSSDDKTGCGVVLWTTVSRGLSLNPGGNFTNEVFFNPSEFENISLPNGFVGDLPPYRSTVIRLVHWNNYSYGEFGATERKVTLQKTRHEGNLVVEGTQVLLIENCTYTETGNISVSGSGRLEIRNSELRINQSFIHQYGIAVNDSATLTMESTRVNPKHLFSISVSGKASLTVNSTIIPLLLSSAIIDLEDDAKAFAHNSELFMMRCWGRGDISIFNSHVGSFDDFGAGTIIFHNCTVDNPWFNGFSTTFLYDCVIGRLGVWGSSNVSVYDSRINESETSVCLLVFGDAEADLHDLTKGFFRYWNVYENQSVSGISWNLSLWNTEVSLWGVICVGDSEVSVSNSTLELHLEDGNSVFSASDSNLTFFGCVRFNGTCLLDKVVIGREGWSVTESHFFLFGEIVGLSLSTWSDSNDVTRSFIVLTQNARGDSVENVELTLLDRNENVVWNGMTGSLGTADFNLTFADSNHTDTLTLWAATDSYSSAVNIDLLTSSPAVLRLRYFADLNGDGTVNIVDIATVAVAYQTGPGDEKWDVNADIDKNKIINIVDVTMVAKDYGKIV